SALLANAKTIHFVNEMYKHCKAIAATGEGVELIRASSVPVPEKGREDGSDPALLINEKGDDNEISARFIKAIAAHRNWAREKTAMANTPA
ncbi:MAG: catalase HPII, partial [Chthoniobacterales bacterium]|nr:catalase HPII [Chthoniobacterales bacterium]